jgi:hypothetical protein
LLHVKDILLTENKSNGLDNSLQNIIISELTASDLAILSSIQRFSSENKTTPTASDILLVLKKHHPLKRSHLYERLTFLVRTKLIAVDRFNHPRRYILNHSTLARGVIELVVSFQDRMKQVSRELELALQDLNHLDPQDVVNLLRTKIEDSTETEVRFLAT